MTYFAIRQPLYVTLLVVPTSHAPDTLIFCAAAIVAIELANEEIGELFIPPSVGACEQTNRSGKN